ncbi:MAG: hypothetical protein ACLUGD_10195 [Ruminococcus sp.]
MLSDGYRSGKNGTGQLRQPEGCDDGMESEVAWSIMAKDVPEFMKEDSQQALSFEVLDEE